MYNILILFPFVFQISNINLYKKSYSKYNIKLKSNSSVFMDPCEQNSDCLLPLICCKGMFIDYCCDSNALLKRIKKRNNGTDNPIFPPIPKIPKIPFPMPRPIPIPIPVPVNEPFPKLLF